MMDEKALKIVEDYIREHLDKSDLDPVRGRYNIG